MRVLIFAMAVLCTTLVVGCETTPAGLQGVAAAFVGEWEVTPRGFYAENPDGSRTYPFGEDAVGRVIMTTTGHAANQFQRRVRSNCVTGTSPMHCTPDEAVAAFRTAVAYQYRYTLEPDADDPLHGRILWMIDYATYPNWHDQVLPRHYEMSRDRRTWVLIAPFPQNPKLAVRVHLQRIAPDGK